MRRSFRVATVFTGAAACAAALTPAAQAAPVATGAAARITPDITGATCTTNPMISDSTNSVHLYYTASEHHTTGACFAGTGYYNLGAGKRFKSYCGGTYSGSFEISGTFRHFTAGTAYHNLYGALVEDVYISKMVANRIYSKCSQVR